MLFQEFEMHIMTKLSFNDIVEKLKTAGYKCTIGLVAEEEGVKLGLMTNNMHIESMINLYGEKDGYYIYEVKLKTKDDFMKTYDIMSAI